MPAPFYEFGTSVIYFHPTSFSLFPIGLRADLLPPVLPGCPLQAEGVRPEGALQEGQVRETPGPGGAVQVRLNNSNICGNVFLKKKIDGGKNSFFSFWAMIGAGSKN